MAKQLSFSIKILGTDTEIKNIEQLKGSLKSVNDALSKADFGTEEYAELSDAADMLKAKLFQLNKEGEIQQKLWKSTAFPHGSYREIQAETAALTEQLRQNVRGVTMAEEAYDELEKNVIKGKKALADFDRQLTPGGTLVGEYARGIQQAFDELGVKGFFDKLNVGIRESSGVVEGSIGAVEAELKELISIQKQFTAQGSAEFDILQKKIEALAQEARGYRDDLKDAAKVEGFDNITASVAKVGTAFVSSFGAISTAFASSEEDAQKITAEIIKNIQYVQAISEVAEASKQVGILNSVAVRKLEEAQIYLSAKAESSNTVVKYAAIAANKLLAASNPYGLIATAIIAVVGIIVSYNRLTRDASILEQQRMRAIQLRADAEKKAAEQVSGEIARLEKIRIILNDTKTSTEQRKRALEEYNSVADKSNQLSEKDLDNQNKINDSILRQIELQKKRALLKAAEDIFSEAIKEQLEVQVKQNKEAKEGVSFFKQLGKTAAQYYNALKEGDFSSIALIQMGIGNQIEAAKELEEATLNTTSAQKLLEEVLKEVGKDLFSEPQTEAASKFFTNISKRSSTAIKDLQQIIDGELIKSTNEAREREKAEREKTFQGQLEQIKEIQRKLIEEEKKNNEELRKNKFEQDKIKSKKARSADDELELKQLKIQGKQLAEQRKEIQNDIAKAEEESSTAQKIIRENFRKDISAIDKKYDEYDLNLRIAQIQLREQTEVAGITERSLKVQTAIEQEFNKGLISDKQREERLKAERLRFDKERLQSQLQSLREQSQNIQQEMIRLQGATASVGGLGKVMTEEEEKRVEELKKIYAELQKSIAEAENGIAQQSSALSEKLKNDIEKAATSTLGVIADISSQLSSFIQEFGNRELDAFDERMSRTQNNISELEKKVNESSGRQKLAYQKRLKAEQQAFAQAEKEREEVRLKYARAKKATDIIQATIQGALAAMNAYNSMAGIPIVGPALGAVAAAATAAFTAVQIGLIASAKLKDGGDLSGGDITDVQHGYIPSGAGEIQGPGHNSKTGGVPFKYKGRQYVAEGGEMKTNNGNRRYVFTKGVTRDPLLKKMALATHNSTGSPLAHLVASMVNVAGGGRGFSGLDKSIMLAGGGELSGGGNTFGPSLVPQAIVVTNSTDPNVIKLISEVNQQNQILSARVDELQRRQETMKIAVPVDRVTDLQKQDSETREAGFI